VLVWTARIILSFEKINFEIFPSTLVSCEQVNEGCKAQILNEFESEVIKRNSFMITKFNILELCADSKETF
jgi:hypothetical protein